jgi:hypothetical protein
MKTNLMHYLFLIYFINQPLHVSGIPTARRQEVFTLYVPIATHIQRTPPDDGQICLKHAEVEWRNKLRIKSASSWFSLQRFQDAQSAKQKICNNDYCAKFLEPSIHNDMLHTL